MTSETGPLLDTPLNADDFDGYAFSKRVVDGHSMWTNAEKATFVSQIVFLLRKLATKINALACQGKLQVLINCKQGRNRSMYFGMLILKLYHAHMTLYAPWYLCQTKLL